MYNVLQAELIKMFNTLFVSNRILINKENFNTLFLEDILLVLKSHSIIKVT